MSPEVRDALRCSHCGDRLTSTEGGRVLYDHCAAYPVVDGIGYLRADELAERALAALGTGDEATARCLLLSGGVRDVVAVQRLVHDPPSFRDAVAVLVPGPEGDHFVYRFSDPVFVASDYLFRAAAELAVDGMVLDFGGGSGHLTRGLVRASAGRQVVTADVSFAKLWLARRYVAPGASAICCDGNQVLPFAARTFSLVASSDAFHYVWSRQLLAGELKRLCADDGVLVLAHLHNLLTYNPSAGMPLTPQDYRRLLGPRARLLKEDSIIAAALARGPLDVRGHDDDELLEAPVIAALVGSASMPDELEPPADLPVRSLAVNPLYRRVAGTDRWVITPPSEAYAEEYSGYLRYLPEQVEIGDALLDLAARGAGGGAIDDLVDSRVLLDLPESYV